MPASPISLDQLRDYVYCSMLFYWKHVARIRGDNAPRTTIELAGESVRQAWRIYAGRARCAHAAGRDGRLAGLACA